ncbi:signal transduction histidine kinase [Roseospira visakhapatnamensis]|uniref:histidine kinase n=2 Tax=Roseospira visakhapatnamensis TaxID=390880 RepID=A0A7W6WC68_9PROT|nr:signal transduction histidine kinase [Roseospira visakhapatnamensis]
MPGNWSITRWVASIFAIALMGSLLAVGLLVRWQEQASVQRIAQEQAVRSSRHLFDHIYAAMLRGSAREDILDIGQRITEADNGTTIRFIRSPGVAAAYGERPETRALRETDPAVRAAFRTGREQLLPDDETFRFLYPLPLRAECTGCHEGVVGETVNGVIDIRFETAHLVAPFNDVVRTAFLGFLAVLTVVFLVIFLLLRRHVVKPIHDLAATMTAIRQSQGLSRRLSLRPRPYRARELTMLATTFNELMAEVDTRRHDLLTRGDALAAARDQAERARLDADAANLAKSQFLASMSHELRTPLNAVLGFSEVLRDEVFGPLGNAQYQGYARDIHDSGAHLRDLIDDMLNLARIEAGEGGTHPEALDLASVVGGCERLYRERLAQSTLTLIQDCPHDLPPVYADPQALRQCLDNLVSNAIKFTPPGGTIRVSGATRADGGVSVAVADSGVGIARDLQDLIFSPYGRVANLHTRTTVGTGLGLALVKALMEQTGGTVALSSRPGHGATFTLAFPPAPSEEHARASEPPPATETPSAPLVRMG